MFSHICKTYYPLFFLVVYMYMYPVWCGLHDTLIPQDSTYVSPGPPKMITSIFYILLSFGVILRCLWGLEAYIYIMFMSSVDQPLPYRSGTSAVFWAVMQLYWSAVPASIAAVTASIAAVTADNAAAKIFFHIGHVNQQVTASWERHAVAKKRYRFLGSGYRFPKKRFSSCSAAVLI